MTTATAALPPQVRKFRRVHAALGVRHCLRKKAYSRLKRLLGSVDPDFLHGAWEGFESMQKAVIFKLMEPRAAMNFYREIPFPERYFLLGAFELGSIGPVLEDLPPRTRALFHQLPKECYKRMVDGLTAEEGE